MKHSLVSHIGLDPEGEEGDSDIKAELFFLFNLFNNGWWYCWKKQLLLITIVETMTAFP